MPMENLFSNQLLGGERPDIQLCIFPHLKEFLVIDLREDNPNVLLLNAADVFTDDLFRAIEVEFSEAIREETEFPFAHLMDLPIRLEEVIRETAMTFILDRLGVSPDVEPVPTIVVFFISGSALSTQSELILDGLKRLLQAHCGPSVVADWEAVLSRLIAEESATLRQLNQHELTEALQGDSPDYFTLWESRN